MIRTASAINGYVAKILGVVPDLGLSVANVGLAAGFYTPVRDEFLYYLAVGTTADPLKLAPQLRAAVANVNPDLQLGEFRPSKKPAAKSRWYCRVRSLP